MEPVKSSTSEVEIVYPAPISPLLESEHNDTLVLTKKVNELVAELNRLQK